MKKYILFLGCFCAVMSNCSQSPVTTSTSSEQRRKTKTIPSSIKASEIIIKSHSSKSTPSPSPAVASQSEDFKAWFGSLGATAEPGKISKANIKIGAPNWLDGFNFTDNKSVVVNASNESISFGGGGLNGALHKYATQKEGQTEWKQLRLPDYARTTPTSLKAGEYAISDITYGEIYHAVGPQASNTSDLSTAQGMVEELYYNMLVKASETGVTCIVLPAISTAIFAGSGKDFTKEQFIAAMYEGMYRGIRKFETSRSPYTLIIVLNLWNPVLG